MESFCKSLKHIDNLSLFCSQGDSGGGVIVQLDSAVKLVSVHVGESKDTIGRIPAFHVSVSAKGHFQWIRQVMRTVHQTAGSPKRWCEQNKYTGSEFALCFILLFKYCLLCKNII